MRKRVSLSISFLLIGIATYYLFDKGIIEKNNWFLSLKRNYFPDICWAFSFFFLSIVFMSNITKKSILLNSFYVILISIIFELLQLFNIIKGTFDIGDIVAYCFSIIIACQIEKKLRRKENEKN